MKNLSKREKILIGIIVFLLLVGWSTGCGGETPKAEEKSFVKEITVKPIEIETIKVEEIQVEEILTETILYEDVSTYWDD